MKKKRHQKVLRPLHANAGIGAEYQARLDALIREMQKSYVYWLRAQYRDNPPLMAQDASPSRELETELRKLGARWRVRMGDAANKLARFFTQRVSNQTERQLKKILRDGGMSVRFAITPEHQDIIRATVAENVSLIKSIHSQYHTQVEGLVMRSVAAGRDLSNLVKELEARYSITRDRAKLIALDQNNKATMAIRRERELSIGLDRGIWLHSHGGKEPRKTHLANSGKEFSVKDGWYDPDPKVLKNIWPAELIRCRCTWKPIVKGFS